MSHESVIAGLKELTKASLMDRDTDAHSDYIHGESDRAMIILEAAVLEDALVGELQYKMPGLNSDETGRVFDYSGPAGSFSARLWLAQGLGILDRATRRRYEVIKDLRNAAAHSHEEITFANEKVRAAAIYLLPMESRAAVPNDASRYQMRCLYHYSMAVFQMHLIGNMSRDLSPETVARVILKAARREASPDK